MDKRLSILVVDDDPVSLMVISSALEDEYNVHTALKGDAAISLLKEHTPDLILLDVMMPDMSGFDLCKIIKSEKTLADIPLIFLTAVATKDYELQGLEIGGIDYITKPVNFDMLKLRVRNHLAMKERRDLVKNQRDRLARQTDELRENQGQLMKLANEQRVLLNAMPQGASILKNRMVYGENLVIDKCCNSDIGQVLENSLCRLQNLCEQRSIRTSQTEHG